MSSFINSFNIWIKTRGYGIEFATLQNDETNDIDTKIQNLKFKISYCGESLVSLLRKFAVTFPYAIATPFVGVAGAIYHFVRGILYGCKSLHGYFKKIDKQDFNDLIKKTQRAFGLALYDLTFSFFFGVLTGPSREEDFNLFFKKIGLDPLSKYEKNTLILKIQHLTKILSPDDLMNPEENGLLLPESVEAIKPFVNKINEFKNNHLDFVSIKKLDLFFLRKKIFSISFVNRKESQLHKLIKAFDLIEWDKVDENLKQRLINWKLLALINYCGEGLDYIKQDPYLQFVKNRDNLYKLASL